MARVFLGSVLVVAIFASVGVLIGRIYTPVQHEQSSTPVESVLPAGEVSQPPSDLPEFDGLRRAFSDLSASVDAEVGLAVGPISSSATETFGSLQQGPAWSTIKVPLAIASERSINPDSTAIKAAITRSDNSAAESLWMSLGDPIAAAASVQAALRDAGDEATIVESQKVRPEYSAFGQTIWSNSEQVRFIKSIACNPAGADVLQLMGEIAQDQRWGLGRIRGSYFKGGWGPSPSGNYLIRQIGLIPTPRGLTAVALAAEPTSGSFTDGVETINRLAELLERQQDRLPAGQC